jgi:hypothetical protein
MTDKQPSFEDNVRQWTVLDTKIRLANSQLREMRATRDDLSKTVCEHMKQTGIDKRKIEIADSKIEVFEKKEYSSLTMSYLEKCLSAIIQEPESVKHILQYIKDKREIKKSVDLKRTFNKGMKKGTAKVTESSGYDSE